MAYILSLDIGTSSSRAMLWDEEFHEEKDVHFQSAYKMHTTSDGGVEIDCNELAKHVEECIDNVMAKLGNRKIDAVGISSFWHSMCGIDKTGKPLTPLYTWADTRSAAAAISLREELDVSLIAQQTGCTLHSSYYPARLRWLADSNAEVFKAVDMWVSPGEFLFDRWFGPEARVISHSMLSGTGLSLLGMKWDEELMDTLKLSLSKFPKVASDSDHFENLTESYAKRWPALKDVPFFPAIGDGACANIGSGCHTTGKMALSLGTSGALRVLCTEDSAAIKNKSRPDGLWLYRVTSTMPLMGAAFSDGGNVHQWLSSTLQLPSDSSLELELTKRSPGQHGLTFLPFMAGERSVGWNPSSKTVMMGMNLNTSPVDIAHATMEAIALRFAEGASRLLSVFTHIHEIDASGGALIHSPAWTQIFTDAIGKPITLAMEPEASSRGAALLAHYLLTGKFPKAIDSSERGTTFHPDPEKHNTYKQMLADQNQLYAKLFA